MNLRYSLNTRPGDDFEPQGRALGCSDIRLRSVAGGWHGKAGVLRCSFTARRGQRLARRRLPGKGDLNHVGIMELLAWHGLRAEGSLNRISSFQKCETLCR